MGEILYRGKRQDNGEWVYGYYLPYHAVKDTNGKDVFAQIFVEPDEKHPKGWAIVTAETVGQYTGLKDKNGTKIFEDDIIKTSRSDTYVIKYGEYIPRNYCLARYYDKPTIGFYAYDGERCFQLSTNSRCYEVIGNIHDNPELLKQGNDDRIYADFNKKAEV